MKAAIIAATAVLALIGLWLALNGPALFAMWEMQK